MRSTLHEGGIRAPWIVRSPGRVKPGTINTTPVITTDCSPTLLEVAGLGPTPDPPLDGRSLVPLLTQSPGFQRDSLHFHYPNYAFHKQNRLASAIREGACKLIKHYDIDSLELYDLGTDIGEKKNLASQSPEVAARLAAKLDHRLREMDARLPTKVAAKENAEGTRN